MLLSYVMRRTSASLCRAPRRPAYTLRGLLTVSSTEGSNEPPLSTATLPEYFANTILPNYASRPGLISRHEYSRCHGGPSSPNLGISRYLAWDFEEFDRHVKALSAGMLQLGVAKGERVGVIMGNCSAYAMLQWACARIGAILVTMNPAYRIGELMTSMKLAGVSHLFVVPKLRSSAYLSALSSAIPELSSPSTKSMQHIGGGLLPNLRSLVVVNNSSSETDFLKEMSFTPVAIDFREVLKWGSDDASESIEALHRDDIINIQFTSGTTGYPKGVSLTHSNLLNNGLFIGSCMPLTSKDKLCNVPPLFHCFAWVHGAAILYSSESFDPVAIVDALHEDKCTALHGVPTHFLGVLSEVKKRRSAGVDVDTSALRTGVAAGSSIPISLMRQLIDEINLTDLTIAYGMTETSPVSFQTVATDSLTQRIETVGRIAPHCKAKILDPASGNTNPLPIGVPGELCVSGHLLQKGYWEDEKQTQEVMRKHDDDPNTLWMHTGDVGVLDAEGYLRIVGRIKDVIIRGGEVSVYSLFWHMFTVLASDPLPLLLVISKNLFPVQIENRLTAHPLIREAAAVSVPHPILGEVVGVWLVRESASKPDAASSISRKAVREWVASGMNPQNAPAWVWFVGEDGVPDQLPKTGSGKVQKHILRAWSRDLSRQGIGRTRHEHEIGT